MRDGWRTTTVGQIATVITGSTPETKEPDHYGGDVPFVTPGDLGKERFVHSAERTLSERGAIRARIVPKGAVLLTCIGATIGKAGIAVRPLCTNQQINALITDQSVVDSGFLYDALTFRVAQLRRWAGTQAVPIINKSTLEKLPIDIPELFEQRRIEEIMRTWDVAINTTASLIRAKARRIRGMLADNVTDARRFYTRDGWETTTVGQVATLVQQRVTWDEDAIYRLITVKRGCGGLVFRGDRKGHEILTKDMYTVRAGDFLISKRQVVHGAWAMVSPEFDGAHVSKEYACLRAKPGKLWMPYFDWLSRTERLQHEAFICSYGVDIEKMVLNVEWLLQTPILLPRSIEAQKAMAAGLDCLQREVELLQAQMDALGRQKRGLMQKLLTGEWRVPVRDYDVYATAVRVTEEAAQ